jgi:2-hydroxy-3-keto-5-methylthiopentenyl-1-phosphate phosphatase
VKTLLQCDFDATLTIGDVSYVILDHFVDGDWRPILHDFIAGKITVEQCMTGVFALAKATPKEVDDFVATTDKIVMRPGIEDLDTYCRSHGIDLAVISNGMEYYIHRILARVGWKDVDIYAASSDITREGIRLHFIDPEGNPTMDGFKKGWASWLRRRGGYDRVYYAGDGPADIAPSKDADHVFATGRLLAFCEKEGLDCTPFEDLHTIIDWLEANAGK